MFEPLFAYEGFASSFNLLARYRVDHVVVIGGDLLVQALARMRQQIPVIVHSAAPARSPTRRRCSLKPRRAVDNEEFGTAQAAPDELVEHDMPSFGTLAAHTLDREQDVLTVRTHADDDKQRDRCHLAVEPSPTTVPSRINRTIVSSASQRAFQASPSLFPLRHTRLTVSLPTAPANNVLSAPRTRRVLVPAR